MPSQRICVGRGRDVRWVSKARLATTAVIVERRSQSELAHAYGVNRNGRRRVDNAVITRTISRATTTRKPLRRPARRQHECDVGVGRLEEAGKLVEDK